jgi:hypothetical protein
MPDDPSISGKPSGQPGAGASEQPSEITVDAVSEAFYSQALARIARTMLVGGLVLAIAAWARFGGRVALGFAIGCAIAYFNFYRLKRVVVALGDRATQTSTRQSGVGLVLRFLLRYFLMAAVAYVMIKRWPESLNGLLVGLFLPVLAVMVEAMQELAFSFTRE